MTPSLSSYIESISNPVGHFNALAGIFAPRDPQGNIPLRVLTHSVNFPVEWRGVAWQLKCFLSRDEAVKTRARLIAARLAQIHSPYVPQYLYLEEEMAVWSASGRASRQDVVMQRIGPGAMLHEALQGYCDRDEAAPVQTIFGHVVRLAELLSEQGLSHRNIKPSNLFVTPDRMPVLLNWDFAEPCDDDMDNLPLARLALGLWLLGCRTALYRHLGRQHLFTGNAAAEMLPAGSAPEPLTTLAALIRQADGLLEGRAVLHDCLDALAALEPSPDHLPEAMRALDDPAPQPPVPPLAVVGARPDVSGYRAAGGTAEGLTRVQRKDRRWIYIDLEGKPQFGRAWDYATDFEEGRAVVGNGELQTLLARTGEELMPTIYHAVEWDASSGTAQATQDGRTGLFNRAGEQLTPLRYDWMSQFREGLLLVREAGKYGFLDRVGHVALPFVYTRASSFSGGRAPVELEGKCFDISPEGKVLQTA